MFWSGEAHIGFRRRLRFRGVVRHGYCIVDCEAGLCLGRFFMEMKVEWLPRDVMVMGHDGTNFFGAMIFGPKIKILFFGTA